MALGPTQRWYVSSYTRPRTSLGTHGHKATAALSSLRGEAANGSDGSGGYLRVRNSVLMVFIVRMKSGPS